VASKHARGKVFVCIKSVHLNLPLLQSLWLNPFTISIMRDPKHCSCGYQFRHKTVKTFQKSNGWIAKVWIGQHFIWIPGRSAKSNGWIAKREHCGVAMDVELNKAFIVVVKKNEVDTRERANLDKTFFWEHFEDELSSEDEQYWRPPPFRRMLGSPGDGSPGERSPRGNQATSSEPEGEPEPTG
jgi:hypothetical protein